MELNIHNSGEPQFALSPSIFAQASQSGQGVYEFLSNDEIAPSAKRRQPWQATISQRLLSPQPQLPTHLDKLLDQPWSPEASRLLDWWLWYVQQEFELTRIANKVGGEG